MEENVVAFSTGEESVLPRTLVLRRLGNTCAVFGGIGEDVWCAAFYDPDEAKTWIIASRQFGYPVRGVKLNGAGIQSGAVPAGANESDRGSGGEACESRLEGGPRPLVQLPDGLPLSSGNEMGGERETGGSPAETP